MKTFHSFWLACMAACTLAFGLASSPAWSQGYTMTCHYLTGPRAGQTQNFTGVPGVSPIPVGSPCTDLYGSYGVGIAEAGRMTLTCQFTSGPRAGQAQSYAGVPGVSPIPVGAPCSDLQGSTGYGI